jgi:hypothetical protein
LFKVDNDSRQREGAKKGRRRRLVAALAASTVAVLGLAVPAQAAGNGTWALYPGGVCSTGTVTGRVAWGASQGYAWTDQISGSCILNRPKVKVQVTGLVIGRSATYEHVDRVETPLLPLKPTNQVYGKHAYGGSAWQTTWN